MDLTVRLLPTNVPSSGEGDVHSKIDVQIRRILDRGILDRGILERSCPDVNKVFVPVFAYHQHPLSGTAVHYAIYQIALEERSARNEDRVLKTKDLEWVRNLERLKEYDASLEADASFEYGVGQDLFYLTPCTLAAGLGSCCAVETLIELCGEGIVNKVSRVGPDDYYGPLHSAAHEGEANVVKLLIERFADVTRRIRQNETVLHALAEANYPMSGDDLESVVHLLIKKKASVTAKTTDAKTPLEYALFPGSHFPQKHLHLLASSCHPASACYPDTRHTIFEDLCQVSNGSTAAALSMAEHIQSNLQFIARYDAQNMGEGESLDIQDRLANLIYTAPLAAAKILRVLIDTPCVTSPEQHPLEKVASFRGIPNNCYITCAYEPEVVRVTRHEESGDRFDTICKPAWTAELKENGIWFYPTWHARFMPKVKSIASGRLDYVHECTVKALYVPNVLDIDIMWAIALARDDHVEIFQELSIQAIITGMWQGLCYQVFVVDLLLSFAEALVMVRWGFVRILKDYLECVEILRFVLLGVALKDAYLCLSWTLYYLGKRFKTKRKKEMYEKSSNGRYQSLWNFRNLVYGTPLLISIVRPLLLFWFVYVTARTDSKDDTNAVVSTVLLVVNLLIVGLKIVSLFRGIEVQGKRMTALVGTFLSGSLWEMLGVCSMFLAVAYMTFSTLLRGKFMNTISMLLYRSILFGDGDSLGYLGLSPTCADKQYEQYYGDGSDIQGSCTDIQSLIYQETKVIVMLLVTFLFSIVIVNLIIAVYSNEYERVELRSPLYFMKNRAHMNVRYYFQQKLWSHFIFLDDNPLVFRVGLLVLFVMTILHWNYATYSGSKYVFSLLIASCEALLFACGRSGRWLDFKSKAHKNDTNYLWVCYRSDLITDVLQNSKVIVSDLNNLARKSDVEGMRNNIKSTIEHKYMDPAHLEVLTQSDAHHWFNAGEAIAKIEGKVLENKTKLQELLKGEMKD